MTPGNHDGVHLGHRALLEAAREEAAPRDLSVTVLTFDPHPTQVLVPEKAPPLLTTLERRLELLRGLGADHVEVLRFDRARARQAPEDFVREVLVERLGARGVVVGPDFRFGRGAAGDARLLETMGPEHGFGVREVGPVQLEGAPVSSTRIRRALAAGDVALAGRLLGRVHDVDGTVIEGDRRGRTIGFPTANLDCDPVLLPEDGVYAVVGRPEGAAERRLGVANLGVRPTFAAGRSVEVHFFDFDGDLYGTKVRLGFVARLRGERKFDGLEALKAQIDADARAAREVLAEADREAWAWI